jgi:hypothetical protein
MIRVGRSTAIVFSFTGGPDEPFEKMEMIGLILIERIEPMEAAAHA